MVLLSDEAQGEALFSLFGDSANLDARLVHGLCQMYHRLINRFGHIQWNYSRFGPFANSASVGAR
jgi:hypothetical protein